MKKLIVLCIIFTLLLSLVLTACTTDPNDTSAQSEDSSFEESSEPPIVESSDITDETSEVSDETSITEDSSIPQENFEQDESSRPETLYFDNANVADAVRNRVTHDYCVCGTAYYDAWEPDLYEYGKWSPANNFPQFLIDYGYITTWEDVILFMYSDEYDEMLPTLYQCLRHFGVTKEDYLEYREQELKSYYEDGYHYACVLTDREIEIVYGNYSKEFVMKELKLATNFYYNGSIYTVYDLAYEKVSDELFKEMLETEEFRIYIFDIKELYSEGNDNYYAERLLNRVETIKAEMENE